MPPVNADPERPDALKALIEFQASTYDKASTYTKVIIGLGYGGFFTAWSGAKQHLSPKLLLSSALFEIISLVLFVVFEIWGAMVSNHLLIEFAEAVSKPVPDVPAALQTHRDKSLRMNRHLVFAWKIVFPACAITGLLGGLILIYAFVAGLFRM
jgi:hypothetical protein